VKYKTKKTIIPKIQAIYWNGEPDVDAVCRMIYNPRCEFNNDNFPLSSNKPSPFNSQNIIIRRDIVKDYFLFPFNFVAFNCSFENELQYHLKF
jgi:hypothetical protein